jgi:hypothetical protein
MQQHEFTTKMDCEQKALAAIDRAGEPVARVPSVVLDPDASSSLAASSVKDRVRG